MDNIRQIRNSTYFEIFHCQQILLGNFILKEAFFLISNICAYSEINQEQKDKVEQIGKDNKIDLQEQFNNQTQNSNQLSNLNLLYNGVWNPKISRKQDEEFEKRKQINSFVDYQQLLQNPQQLQQQNQQSTQSQVSYSSTSSAFSTQNPGYNSSLSNQQQPFLNQQQQNQLLQSLFSNTNTNLNPNLIPIYLQLNPLQLVIKSKILPYCAAILTGEMRRVAVVVRVAEEQIERDLNIEEQKRDQQQQLQQIEEKGVNLLQTIHSSAKLNAQSSSSIPTQHPSQFLIPYSFPIIPSLSFSSSPSSLFSYCSSFPPNFLPHKICKQIGHKIKANFLWIFTNALIPKVSKQEIQTFQQNQQQLSQLLQQSQYQQQQLFSFPLHYDYFTYNNFSAYMLSIVFLLLKEAIYEKGDVVITIHSLNAIAMVLHGEQIALKEKENEGVNKGTMDIDEEKEDKTELKSQQPSLHPQIMTNSFLSATNSFSPTFSPQTSQLHSYSCIEAARKCGLDILLNMMANGKTPLTSKPRLRQREEQRMKNEQLNIWKERQIHQDLEDDQLNDKENYGDQISVQEKKRNTVNVGGGKIGAQIREKANKIYFKYFADPVDELITQQEDMGNCQIDESIEQQVKGVDGAQEIKLNAFDLFGI